MRRTVTVRPPHLKLKQQLNRPLKRQLLMLKATGRSQWSRLSTRVTANSSSWPKKQQRERAVVQLALDAEPHSKRAETPS